MKKDFAFPQLPVQVPVKKFPRGSYKIVPIMSDNLLTDLAQLAIKESEHATNMADYINLRWIAEDIERRRRDLKKVRP